MPVSRKTTPPVSAPTPLADEAAKFVLDRIRGIQAIRSLKICIYGLGKRGKTRLACTLPKPLLLIGTEEGTQSVLGYSADEVKFVPIFEPTEVQALVEYAPKMGFKSVVLDNGSGLQDLVVKKVGGFKELPVQGSWGMLKREQWGAVASQWKREVKSILDLSDRFGIYTAIIAHERDFKKEDDDNSASEDNLRSVPRIGPGLTPAVSNWLNGACDYVCNCFLRERVEKYQEAVVEGTDPVDMIRYTGEYEYGIRVGPSTNYATGFRLPPGAILPKVIIDPTFDKIKRVAEGKWKDGDK